MTFAKSPTTEHGRTMRTAAARRPTGAGPEVV